MKRTNMYRIVGGKRIHVNQLAANSRKFSVSNNTIHKLGLNNKDVVTMWKEIRTSRFDTPVFGKMFEIDKDGHYHLIERTFDPTPLILNHKQPKRLVKCKKRNDYVAFFKNYPYTKPKMNQVQYMEKLVEHKLAKWERKNPKPMDMFTEEVEKWNQLHENMKMHFRDVVISIYDKLKIVGNYVDHKNKKITKRVVAEIKDINGKGHNVNYPELQADHSLYVKAKHAAINAMRTDRAIIDCDLKNHKGDQTRPLIITKSDLKKAA